MSKHRSAHGIIENAKILREENKYWAEIAGILGIIKPDGLPDPGMIYRMVNEGYEPRRLSTRARLNMKPICPECHQKTPRVVAPWVNEAVDILIKLRQDQLSNS